MDSANGILITLKGLQKFCLWVNDRFEKAVKYRSFSSYLNLRNNAWLIVKELIMAAMVDGLQMYLNIWQQLELSHGRLIHHHHTFKLSLRLVLFRLLIFARSVQLQVKNSMAQQEIVIDWGLCWAEAQFMLVYMLLELASLHINLEFTPRLRQSMNECLWLTKYHQFHQLSHFISNSAANHAVMVVGWLPNYQAPGATTSGPVWILRNSWGTSWGESGYAYIDASKNVIQICNTLWYYMY